MEDIVVVKKGIVPKIYYVHTCSQCDAVMDIIETVTKFNCPECESHEVCIQDQKTLKKVYLKENNITRMDSGKNLKKKGKK
jgi:predicted RNA-binding Zn-ribbon protein involved in translation (DUF1610 family)